MSSNILRALELAKAANQGRLPAGANARRRRVPAATKSVDVSPEVMRRNRLVAALDDQRLRDCYALLQARLLQRARLTAKLRLIGVTSPSAQDGKTLTAVNLALTMAEAGHSVLLVDADLRRPSVAAAFGIKVDAGLGDYLMGKSQLEDVLLNTSIPRLTLLPANPATPLVMGSLSSERMLQLVRDLKEAYHEGFVVFDLPPALVGGEVVALAPHLDGNLLVVAEGRTKEEALRTTLRVLDGVPLLGTVMNFASELISSEEYYA